jgi:hypothetical protein
MGDEGNDLEKKMQRYIAFAKAGSGKLEILRRDQRIAELEEALRDVVTTWAAGSDGKDMAKAMIAANKVLRRGSQPKPVSE